MLENLPATKDFAKQRGLINEQPLRKAGLVSFAFLVLLICSLTLIMPAAQATESAIGGDFTLTDHHGKPYSLEKQRGKAVVMFFGFTHCPSICPDSLVKMASVVKNLQGRTGEISVVFISVDPERDTVEKLAQYVTFFSPKLLGLTGSTAQIDAVTQAYRARYKLVKKTPQDAFYNVDHSADIYVLDRTGQVDTIVPYGMPASHVLKVVEGVLARPFAGINVEQPASKVEAERRNAEAPLAAAQELLSMDSNGISRQKLALHDLENKQHLLKDYRGSPLLINFWATWCPPCRAELPALNRAWAALKEDGIAMLAVNVGEEEVAVNAFLQDFPIDFPVLLDEQGNSMQRWQIKGMPTTVILDGEGGIAHHIVGEKVWDDPEILQQIRAVAQ